MLMDDEVSSESLQVKHDVVEVGVPRVSTHCAVLVRHCRWPQRAPVATVIDMTEHAGFEIIRCLRGGCIRLGNRSEAFAAHEPGTKPGTATVAETVCVVGWGAVGDSLGGSGVDVTQSVRHLLKFVCIKSHLVGQDEVVS